MCYYVIYEGSFLDSLPKIWRAKVLQSSQKIKINTKEVKIMVRKGESIFKRKDGRYEGRYIKEYKQKEIAAEINISQAEVSKRLVELSQLVKTHFEA